MHSLLAPHRSLADLLLQGKNGGSCYALPAGGYLLLAVDRKVKKPAVLEWLGTVEIWERKHGV